MNNDGLVRTDTHFRFPENSRPLRHLLVVIFAGMALTLAACSASATSTPTTHSPSGSSSTAGGATDSITIHNFAFSPSTITVDPGATVTVTNRDQVAHTLTASHGAFDTGDIAPGQSKTLTAPKTPGTYTYFCMIHQYMTGTVVVSG